MHFSYSCNNCTNYSCNYNIQILIVNCQKLSVFLGNFRFVQVFDIYLSEDLWAYPDRNMSFDKQLKCIFINYSRNLQIFITIHILQRMRKNNLEFLNFRINFSIIDITFKTIMLRVPVIVFIRFVISCTHKLYSGKNYS